MVKNLFLPQLNPEILAGILLMIAGVMLTAFLIGTPLFFLGFFLFWLGIYQSLKSKTEYFKKILDLLGLAQLPSEAQSKLWGYFLIFFFLMLFSIILLGPLT